MIKLNGRAATLAAATVVMATAAAAQQPAADASAAPARSPTQTATALVSQGVAPKAETDPSCPKIVLAPAGSTFPARDDAYKATLDGVARDCANLGAETILTIAAVGAGERDGADAPSWFNAPLSVAVLDDRGRPVATSRTRIKVQLARGATKGRFSTLIENVSLPPASGYVGWTIVVGFETTAAQARQAATLLTARR